MTEQEELDYEMLPQYDFTNAKPNPYAARANAPGRSILIEPDLLQAFPTSEAVNEALRSVLEARKDHAA